MRRSLMALGAALVIALTPAVASADFGTYETADGPSCSWSGSGGFYMIDCSGYSRRAGGYVSYHCDYTVFGQTASWSCRDSYGNTWRGSR